jgi:hypothetical protein
MKMKCFRLAGTLVLLAFAIVPVSAKGLSDILGVRLEQSFVARLSHRDHFNSRGERLTTIAQIIRQDRANFHRFNRRDPEDTSDSVFNEYENRRILEVLVDRAYDENTPVEAIVVNQTPKVRVEIYGGTLGGQFVRSVVVRIIEP